MKLFATLSLALILSSQGATLWNENDLGDLSNDYLSPAEFTLQPGSNVLTTFTTELDPELFTVTVPAGFQISFLNLLLYQHNNFGNETFIGFQDGSNLLQDPLTFTRATSGNISWLTYGFTDANTDLLEDMTSSPNASPPPLQAGTYSFWINEIETDPAITVLDFVVTPSNVPEPSPLLLSLAAGLITILRRHRG